MTQIENSRPVSSRSEQEFGVLMASVLSPSRPLQSEEFLRGRAEHLAGIRRAFFQPGRHILIHGLRGVGKSSLAQTAAFQLSERIDPILVGCDRSSTFTSVIRDIFDSAESLDPRLTEKTRELAGGFSKFGITANGKVQLKYDQKVDPSSINEAVRLIDFISKSIAGEPVFVVDEFDLLKDSSEQEAFADFAKQLSDRHINARFIFCGIAQSAELLMAAHASVDRYFHTIDLGRLPWEARFEIVQEAATQLGLQIDDNTVIRIAMISDGFPHYVHFISEKLFWCIFEANNGGEATPQLFEEAMIKASDAMDMKLRAPYEKATRKYQNDYEYVLWAAADGHEFTRRSADIFSSYERIMRNLDEDALPREKFNQRINSLKKPTHDEVLTGSRQGWYEFTEKMLRGYVRLRAAQANVLLYGDHPNITNSPRWKDLP